MLQDLNKDKGTGVDMGYKDIGLIKNQAQIHVFYHHLQFLNFSTVQESVKD